MEHHMDTDLSTSVENASLLAWPALREERVGNWLVRLSQGYTKRVNSVNEIPGSALPDNPAEAVAACESLYDKAGLNPIFRITEISSLAGLEPMLAEHGYTRTGRTVVMHADISDPSTKDYTDLIDASIFSIHDAAPAEWLELYAEYSDLAPDRKAVHRKILTTRNGKRLLAVLKKEGKPVAVGMAGLHDGQLGLFQITVSPEFRGSGLGSAMLKAVLAWGFEHGASGAYCQVEEHNNRAFPFYTRLGFAPLYRYHYLIR